MTSLAKPEDVTAMTGREVLQAIIDGRLPPPPIAETLSFRLVEVGDGFAVFEGDPGPHLLNCWVRSTAGGRLR